MPISPISPLGPEPIRHNRAATRRKPANSGTSETEFDEVLISSVETTDEVDPPHKQNDTDDHTGKAASSTPTNYTSTQSDHNDLPHLDIRG